MQSTVYQKAYNIYIYLIIITIQFIVTLIFYRLISVIVNALLVISENKNKKRNRANKKNTKQDGVRTV